MNHATLRAIHGVLALALATLLAVYAVSGWLIVHGVDGGAPEERTVVVSGPAVGGEREDPARVGELAAQAARAAGLADARVVRAELKDAVWRASLRRVARSAEVTLTPGATEARVVLRDAALREGLAQLHHVNAVDAGGARLAWALLIDALSLSLLGFAATGVLLFLRVKRDRRLGWALLGASTLYTLGGIAWLALSR